MKRRRAVIVFLGGIFVAATGVIVWNPPLVRTDQEPRGPIAQNETTALVDIYFIEPDGQEVFVTIVPRGQSQELFGLCGAELVARLRSGELVERRASSIDCDMTTWRIEMLLP